MSGLWRDIRWAVTAFRAKRLRHRLSFAARVRFDAELRPRVWDGDEAPRIAYPMDYPDAVYHMTSRDFCRAVREVDRVCATLSPEDRERLSALYGGKGGPGP